MKWILNGFELFSKTNARWAQNTYSNKLNLNQIIYGSGGINKQQQKINQIAWTNHWMLVLFFHNTCWCSLILDYFISHSEINSQNVFQITYIVYAAPWMLCYFSSFWLTTIVWNELNKVITIPKNSHVKYTCKKSNTYWTQ